MAIALTGRYVDHEEVLVVKPVAHLHLVWEDGCQSESLAHRHREPSGWASHSHEVMLPSGETIYTVGYRRAPRVYGLFAAVSHVSPLDMNVHACMVDDED